MTWTAAWIRTASLALAAASAAACSGSSDDAPAADAGVASPDASTLPPALGAFPPGFLWGTAIAPYQVEGGLHGTDWYQWEGDCEGRCSGDSADDGPDYWNRYDEDHALAAAISNNAIRIGIELARVFPTRDSFPDQPDAAAVQGYHDIIDSARSHGLQVMVTLHHFSFPTWLHDMDDLANKAGWVDPEMPTVFEDWARWVGGEYGGEVDYWITINEPFVQLGNGYLSGEWPPGALLDIAGMVTGYHAMVEAHARAYDALHDADTADADSDGQAAWVSIASHARALRPADPSLEIDRRGTEVLRNMFDETFLDAVTLGDVDANFDGDLDDEGDRRAVAGLAGRLDYLGLNFYGIGFVTAPYGDEYLPMLGFPYLVDLDDCCGWDPKLENDLGWGLYAEGLREELDRLGRYGLPVIITENGISDATDTQRPYFLARHLYVLLESIAAGHDVRGYFYWTLTDNFEWNEGYCAESGIYAMDASDPAKPRTLRDSGTLYKRIIDDNTVDPAIFAEYPAYPGPGSTCPR